MSSPHKCDLVFIYRIARYLRANPRLKHVFKVGGSLYFCDVIVDSDWAGDKVSRKSTTGCVLKFGDHTVKTYSRNQRTIALSSGEAELYALVSGVAEALGIQSIVKDFGLDCNIRCFTDSSAAMGIVKRSGIGTFRHLQTQYLWIQEVVSSNKVSIHKVGTNDNVADLLTTYLDGNTIQHHIGHLNLVHSSHRPDNAPQLTKINNITSTRKINRGSRRIPVNLFSHIGSISGSLASLGNCTWQSV